MGVHTIENEYLKVTVADAGAELVSVVDKATGQERIWTGDPAVWNRHAPILFPFVGKLVDGKYRVGGSEYAMKTQHGFARDMEFACAEETPTSIKHILTSNDKTRENYPFDFRLTVEHRLGTGRQLYIRWTVENTSGGEMLYCIGGHPGFLLPEGVNKEDCYITFPGADALHYIHASPAGYAVAEPKALPLEGGRARYRADIPDTWIFEDGQVKAVGIALPDGKPYVSMDCEQFPLLAVWANPKGPFICLEPWFGRADDEGFTGSIDQKKAIEHLAEGGKKEISYRIEFF